MPKCPHFDGELVDDVKRREADRLLSATIYLMSCHARTACPRLASMVERHLELIAGHPESGELVRETCRKLAAAWQTVRGNDERVARERAANQSPFEMPRRLFH